MRGRSVWLNLSNMQTPRNFHHFCSTQPGSVHHHVLLGYFKNVLNSLAMFRLPLITYSQLAIQKKQSKQNSPSRVIPVKKKKAVNTLTEIVLYLGSKSYKPTLFQTNQVIYNGI